MATEVMLKMVPIGFPHLFVADEYEGNKAYTAKFFIEPGSANDEKIKAAILKEAKAKWPEKYEFYLDEFKMDKKAYCYLDGKRVEYTGAAGKWVLSSRRPESSGRPTVIDERLRPLVESDGKPYPGAFVNAKIEIWAQDGKQKGIRCSLLTVQFAKDGESFGGTKIGTTDGFEDLGDQGDEEDLV